MRLELDGEPIHVRAQHVRVDLRDDGLLDAAGSLLDLRTRGFLPVGGGMQGMGIIHHMEMRWTIEPTAGVVRSCVPAQPTVAFEASPETAGESCRDPVGRVAAVADVALGRPLAAALRDAAGGAVGCSHLVTLALFMDAGVRAGLARQTVGGPPRPLWRRDLVFDAHQATDEGVQVGVRLADLDWNERGAGALAPERFARHHELAARVVVDLWPGSLRTIDGGERCRTATDFAGMAWTPRTALLAPLAGSGLARGAAGTITERLGDAADAIPWRDALVMMPAALVQCRAAHPDAWHEKVRATPRHPGLTALPDSCWMWRRDGALARIRDAAGAGKGGR